MNKRDQVYGIRALIFYILIIIGLAFYADKSNASEPPTVPQLLEDHMYYPAGEEGGIEWFPSLPNVIHFVGGVDEGLDAAIRKALIAHPEVDTISLFSGGGSVTAGLEAAILIHEKGLTTYVPELGTCQSACGFLFFAGKERILGGTLGAHQVSVDIDVKVPVDLAYQEVQNSTGYIMFYMKDWKVPQGYYIAMLLTVADDMYIFTDVESRLLEIGEDSGQYDKIDELHEVRYGYLEAFHEWSAAQE